LNDPINFVDPEGQEPRPWHIPGYLEYLRKIAPGLFCNLLKQRVEHAEEMNRACKELGVEEPWKIDPDAYKLLDWCKEWGYIK
jgi:hypothetical protein